MVKKEEFYYDSRDELTKIHAVKWLPEQEPAAVLQLCHGMSEYILRYDRFAQDMAERGILVVGNDHLGHGLSVREGMPYGYFCRRDAATVIVRDVHRLKKMIQEQYPGVPYFILGHSMGSFALRCYMNRYGTGIDGALLLGTGGMSGPAVAGLKLLVGFVQLFIGPKTPSAFAQRRAFGRYNRKIENPRTPYDWLSTQEEEVDAYIADKLCGFNYTTNGFQTTLELIKRCPAQEGKIPKELPVLILSGEEDPVGNYGESVRAVWRRYLELGLTDVSMTLYPGCRHELLNEKNRRQVYEDIYSFIYTRSGRKD